ncbi:hypothetical protein [Opitutus terrae]|uniref:Uncharacterized protein n=1 Tax=Opitutus terrae (strain DSM 11246 / JCM 15787 / PB90-1) TaxID=452637 RepID=B1ZNF3_OPITP|nr:hypothetical protein [Opitutus terrae]ACB74387.1 hypothetical protein Oter_1099 [Opitutus terrae PB90-1]
MSTSLLQVSPPEIRDLEVVYRGTLQPPCRPAVPVEFHAAVPAAPDATVPTRAFLFAFLVPAMRMGTALRLPLPVDPVTLANVMEWQEAMASWCPRTLRVVPILADVAPAAPSANPMGAVSAFSGGIDGCFTAFRHTLAGAAVRHRRAELRAGVMVHGFDIPLTEPAAFARAWQNSVALLRHFGLRAYRLRTNLRTLRAAFGGDWETETHGIWQAAALACFEPWFEHVLIPATQAYPKMRFPWASNAVTDPLFSSELVTYWHDGAAFTKLAKVQALARQPLVAERVRVCWQGEQHDRNCGVCFTCRVTQVCFWLAGVPVPAAFPRRATLAEVAQLPVKSEEHDFLVRQLHDAAVAQGQTELAVALARASRRGVYARAVKGLKRQLTSALEPTSARQHRRSREEVRPRPSWPIVPAVARLPARQPAPERSALLSPARS